MLERLLENLLETHSARYQNVKRALVPLGERTDTVFGGTYGALSGTLVRNELVDVLQIKPYDRTALGMLMGAGSH